MSCFPGRFPIGVDELDGRRSSLSPPAPISSWWNPRPAPTCGRIKRHYDTGSTCASTRSGQVGLLHVSCRQSSRADVSSRGGAPPAGRRRPLFAGSSRSFSSPPSPTAASGEEQRKSLWSWWMRFVMKVLFLKPGKLNRLNDLGASSFGAGRPLRQRPIPLQLYGNGRFPTTVRPCRNAKRCPACAKTSPRSRAGREAGLGEAAMVGSCGVRSDLAAA